MDLQDDLECQSEHEPTPKKNPRQDLLLFEHECTLKDEPHYLTKRIRPQQSCAFRFREWFLIDPRHPKTRRFYSSSFMFRSELVRHIKSDYWFMIHPFSRFRFYWDCWLVFYTYAMLLIIPFVIAFAGTMRRKNYVYAVSTTVTTLATAEVAVNCLTGFSNEKYYHNIQLSPCAIFKNYLKGMFVIDFLFAFPTTNLLRMLTSEDPEWLHVLLHVVDVVWVLKCLSIVKIWGYMTNIYERFGFEMIHYYQVRLVMVSGLFIHWCICMYKLGATFVKDPQYGLDPPWDNHVQYLLNTDNGMIRRYGKCFSTVLYYLFVLSFGELGIPRTVHGKILGGVCIIVGTCFQIYLILQFFRLTTMTSSTKRNYAEAVSQLKAYIDMKQFPKEMANRLMFYYEKKFEKSYFDAENVLSTLSDLLKHQVDDSNAARFFNTVPVFEDVDRRILLYLVRNMEKEIYLPNDIIMKAGTVGSSLCFIYTGTVAVYTQSGKEIGHLHDGDNFGEVSLFFKNKRLVNVIAIEFTQVFVLPRKMFAELVPQDNVLYQRLEEMAKERMKQTLHEEEKYKSHLLMVDSDKEKAGGSGGPMSD